MFGIDIGSAMVTIAVYFLQAVWAICVIFLFCGFHALLFRFFFRKDLLRIARDLRRAAASLRKIFHKTNSTKKLTLKNKTLSDEVVILKMEKNILEKKNLDLERQLAKSHIGTLSLPVSEGGSVSLAEQSGALSEPLVQKVNPKKESA